MRECVGEGGGIVFFSTYTCNRLSFENTKRIHSISIISLLREYFFSLLFFLQMSAVTIWLLFIRSSFSFSRSLLDLQKWSSIINILRVWERERTKRKHCITNRRSQTTLFYKDDTLIISAGERNTGIKSFVFDLIASYRLWISFSIDFSKRMTRRMRENSISSITQEIKQKTIEKLVGISSLNVFDDGERCRVYIKNVNEMIIERLSTGEKKERWRLVLLLLVEKKTTMLSTCRMTYVRDDDDSYCFLLI